MAKEIETQGIVLYNRDYREKDKLVKLFTANAGKQMLFVKGANAPRYKNKAAIQSMSVSAFVLNINENGLSFIKSISETQRFRKIQGDIFLNAYATYLLGLIDAVLMDREVDQPLFIFLLQSLRLIEDGMDAEVVTFIFEVQLLSRFGVHIDFEYCAICGCDNPPFDFSWTHQGVLCRKEADKSFEMASLNPNVLYFLSLFTKVNLEKINKITLKSEMKHDIREFLDLLYDEYVGVHLKSKHFINHMNEWVNYPPLS
ncbi:MAG: DNA repair protein RecO [Streptococcaceae bacterium]|jgi:DNA repair protein RecO (recombination protein O)|nr:DNA repair protein RecO [Streptococcaceae bacterium]